MSWSKTPEFGLLADTRRLPMKHAMALDADHAAKIAGRAQKNQLGQGNSHGSLGAGSIRLFTGVLCAVTHTKYRRAQVPEAEGGIWPRIRRQVQVCSMIHHGYMGTLGLLAGQRLRALRCVTEVTPTARPIPFTGALGAAIVEVAWPAHRASARAVRPQASANRPDRRPPWRWPPAARRAAAPTRPIANRRTTGR